MSRKSKTKNVTSIAIKLNSIFVRNLFLKFLILDVCIIAGFIGTWCVENEINFYGRFVEKVERSFELVENKKVIYKAVWSSGETMTQDATTFLFIISKVIAIVVIIEVIMLLFQIMFGTARNRRVLKPLNDIAEAANRLSNIDFDEQKFENLQAAISKISPDASDERIHIGDSELQGLEDAINDLLDRMRDSYRQQARFVSDASHELRTPIAVIQGYANMLDRWGKDDEEVLNESISAIKSESENMKNLVEQLLFLARGINGKTQLNITRFSLTDMMKEVFEESIMIDKDHIYRYDSIENIEIYGDISLLKQTARILIENAAKYTDKNEEIVLRVGKNDKDESYFSIQDNGIGMEENDVFHIFERFFRADTVRVRKNGGTGLGLSIAKWIVDNHKGYFSVLSRKEIGTRITVYLP